MTTGLVLYDEIASWWPLLSPPADYEEEADFYRETLLNHGLPEPRSLLELGSGGGNNASFLKRHFERVTLVDLSPGMLDVSRALNPECEHREGDMRTIRLGYEFDRVFVHDAICYATTREDLQAVVETAFIHCRPGGSVLFAPDFVKESFKPGTDRGGRDGDGRSLRYLEWTWDPDPSDDTYLVDFAYMLREADGTLRVLYDRHVEGLFAHDDWMSVLRGRFHAHAVPFAHSGVPDEVTVFVGVRPMGG